MKTNLAALIAGIVFGAGLALSGMTDPLKVLAFLTIAPGWDPTLIFVMGSALIVAAVGYALLGTRAAPLLDSEFHRPQQSAIDTRLLIGAGIFGLGWGISGFCPGPAIVAALTADPRGWVFLPAFVIGMLLFETLPQAGAPSGTSAARG